MMSWESSIGQTPPRLPFFLMIVSLHDMARLFLGIELPLLEPQFKSTKSAKVQ